MAAERELELSTPAPRMSPMFYPTQLAIAALFLGLCLSILGYTLPIN